MSHWETQGASDEWYTPAYVFEALGCEFDTDVAHPGRADVCCVPAHRWITANSLEHQWEGFVWMNPPFGGRNSLEPWLGRFFDHGNGIALTPDRTSAPWFWAAWQHADMVLFTRKIRFLRPDGSEGKSPSNGTALWAAGGRACAALVDAANAGLGIIATPRKGSSMNPSPNTGLDDGVRKLVDLERDFKWRAQVCRTNLDAFDEKAAAIWDFAAQAVREKIDAL